MADFGAALVLEPLDKLAGWLVKDNAVMPGTTPDQCAEFLVLSYLFTIVHRRRGVGATAGLLASAVEIAKNLRGGE